MLMVTKHNLRVRFRFSSPVHQVMSWIWAKVLLIVIMVSRLNFLQVP